MFFSKNLSDVDHCFFSRIGGFSKKKYSSLNCGKGSNDNPLLVEDNLKTIHKYFNLPRSKLITMYQTHSNICKIIEPKLQQTEYKCDGIVTKHQNIILSVLTADCAPVLFFDQKKSIIGACHAGWKGALNGIIENTLSSMKLLGANINNINCSIGPCIGQSSYEVKSDFFKIFVDKSIRNRQFFIEINKDKYQFSLKKFITLKLEEQGVGNIDTVNIDTYKDEHLCFSYRRALHKKEDDYGRMISTITIKEDHS